MKTINEVYEELKQKRDNTQQDLEIVYGKANDFLKDFDFKSGVDEIMKNSRLVGEVNAYTDIVTLIEESGVLEQLAEKDKEIEELKTRVSELQDKDWYEACIKQLEEQNDKLIKERDEIQKELETSVDYWKNEVFKKIEVKLTGVTKEKIHEIRHQVCDEIKELAHNYMEMPICECCGENFDDVMIKSYNLKTVLDQVEKGE